MRSSSAIKPVPVPREDESLPAEASYVATHAPDAPFWRRRRRAVAIAALLTVLVGGYALTRKSAAPAAAVAEAKPSMTVTLVPAARATLPKTLLVTGSLAAWDELPIGAEATGLKIDQVLVDEGDRVTKGQLLAKLNDSLLKAQLAQNEAQAAQQEAAIQEAQANVRNARADKARAEELLQKGAISGRDHDARIMTSETSAAREMSARRLLDVIHAQHQEILAKIAQTEIRAPADGYISKRTARLGAVQQVQSAELFHMVREGKIELKAEIPERDLAGIQVGQTATVVPEGVAAGAAAAAPTTGTVRLVSPVVDPQTRIGTAYIRLPDDTPLKPGQFVRAELKLAETAAIVVPEAAVRYHDGEAHLFVAGAAADKGGVPTAQVRERRIQVAGRGGGTVQVSQGVEPGDRVVLAGAGYLKDGDMVRLADAGAPAAPGAGAVR